MGVTLTGGYKSFQLTKVKNIIPPKPFSIESAELLNSNNNVPFNTPCLAFNPDGTAFYAIQSFPYLVTEFELATLWNASSFTANATFDDDANLNNTLDLLFDDTGTKMFINNASTTSIRQYSLTSAYAISTAVFQQQKTLAARYLFWKPDGTKLYGRTSDPVVSQFPVTTPFDVSTIGSAEATKTLPDFGSGNALRGLTFSNDGSKMLAVERLADNEGNIRQYTLSTPWDITTLSADNILLYYPESTAGVWLSWKTDGAKLFVKNPYRINSYTV